MSARSIFITGGASGLGRALAERYARAGWRVCIGDLNDVRGAETLSALRDLGVDAHYLRCDVTKEADLAAAAAWLVEHWHEVDVVVNNAGVAVAGTIAEVPLETWQWIVDINLLGVVRGCKVFTPVFQKQGGGHFVNISSMAGLVHPPLMAAYNATKAAVVALSETLRLELEDDRIGVSVVCPAFFRTNLTESAKTSSPEVKAMMDGLVNKAPRGAPEIANLVFEAVERRDFHVVTHPEGMFAWMLKRLTPWSFYVRLFGESTKRMKPRALASTRAPR